MLKQKVIKIWLLLIFAFLCFYTGRFFITWASSWFDFTPQLLPKVGVQVPVPEISARSAIILDIDSGTIIFQKEPHIKLHPASITKMVTAATVLETRSLNEVITVKQEYPIGRIMGLEAGEKITVENLIYGLLVHSANDAAYVLAGQDGAEIKIFVDRMNEIVIGLGLKDTHFVNFDGEEDEDHYSTAFDLAHIARWSLRSDVFSQAIQLNEILVKDVANQKEHLLQTTNELLPAMEEIKGIKTGWTPQSGECFVGLADFADHQVVTVVLASEDRFGDTQKLVNWIKDAVYWVKL